MHRRRSERCFLQRERKSMFPDEKRKYFQIVIDNRYYLIYNSINPKSCGPNVGAQQRRLPQKANEVHRAVDCKASAAKA